jgi:arylsulfatase A-like enzyme
MKVVIVTARGLRLSLLGCYGNLWVDTPAIDGLAASGIVFDWHFANRADAAGARRAWRSGRLGLPGPGESDEPAAGPDLLTELRGRGVRTCLVHDESRPGWPGFEVDPDFGAGWDEVQRIGTEGEGTPLERALEAAAAALERLAGHDNWILWLDLATPLPPWEVPEEFLEPYFAEEEEDEGAEGAEEGEDEPEEAEELTPVEEIEPGPIDAQDDSLFLSIQSTCAAAVTYLDAGVAQLLETIAELPGGDEVVVAVTADCGLPLGEHGVIGLLHPEPYEEVIHLPLILRLPGALPRRVDALTQAADLAPTVAALFGAELAGAQGQNLLPLARGEAERLRDYVCAGVAAGGGVGWCLRMADWEYVLPAVVPPEVPDRGPRLYVKVEDRWEVNDVVHHHQELAEGFERTLRACVEASRKPGPFTSPPLPEEQPAAS